MKILVIGSGGREHALVWKIAQSVHADKIYCAPGNAGIQELAECVEVKADDVQGLLDFAQDKSIDLTVVGPEAPLALGIVDVFQKKGLPIFGPGKNASCLESSKVFAKNIMKKYNIPTADCTVFSDYEKALDYVRNAQRPLVIKADGLCAGKGVFVCAGLEEQEKALTSIMRDNRFGDAGKTVIIEEKLEGEEASIIVVSDGEHVLTMASSQDHKRIFDNDKGPNTGGMGAYSPASVVTKEIFTQIEREVIIPAIRGMRNENMPYKGVLYAGVMITESGPKVLEFNVRFGDPETQAILPRLKSDIVEIMIEAAAGTLDEVTLQWDERTCVCVVIASGGYPAHYEKGKQIQGLDAVKQDGGIVVFHAGTKREGAHVVTNGGRVFGVTGLGQDIHKAIDTTYVALKKIHFDGMYYRTDIGRKALKRIMNR